MEIISVRERQPEKQRRTAAYARVSTLAEEQQSSFDNQKEYFERIIRENKKWVFAGIYADQGISGTTKERPGFQQMIADAEGGKLDLVLVKSISRFARNAAEAQQVLQRLKECNVEVFFEEQQLSSYHRNTEMILNMMAVVAENESRSISQNTQWALSRLAERGIRHLGAHRVYGYDETDGVLRPNEKAKWVKFIFESYAGGKGLSEIVRLLKEKGECSLAAGNIKAILKNEIYCGDRLLQKQPHQDFLTKKPKMDQSYDSYYVKNSHEAIVSRSLWEKAQKRLALKQAEVEQGIYRQYRSHALAGKIICGCCGSPYRRLRVGIKGDYTVVWKCRSRIMGTGCKNPIIKETQLLNELGSLPSFGKDIPQIRVLEDGRLSL